MTADFYSEYIKIKNHKNVDFLDIQPLLANGERFGEAIKWLSKSVPDNTELVVATEARGFVFGSAIASYLNLGFMMLRKPGKLPDPVIQSHYETEYSTDSLSVAADLGVNEKNAVIVDDVLATGGTAEASLNLLKSLRMNVNRALFFLEIPALNGKIKLEPHGVEVLSMLQYSNGKIARA